MNDTFVLAITGPAGTGKSTVSEKLAKQLKKCVNIDADHIKHMIVSGFYVDENDPENPEGSAFGEWGLLGESIGLLAQNFRKHGFSIIINGYIDTPAWENVEKITPIIYKVLLLPHSDTAVARDAGRNEDVRQGEATIRRHHDHFFTNEFFTDLIQIDSTAHSAHETVQEILDIVKEKS
jgi:hypothetical protein